VAVAHPRISVSSLSSLFQSFDADLEMWKELGVDHVALISPKIERVGWETAPALVDGLQVSNIAAEVQVLHESIDLAAAVGAEVVYILSGTIGTRTWEEATSDFVKRMAPYVEHAKEKGVELGVESTSPFRSDLSFLFTYRDAVDTARQAGMTAVLDMYSCWYERGLDKAVRSDPDMLSLVQVCDFKLGTFEAGIRAVIGEGDVPLERLLGMLLDAGYEGAFDLEILGDALKDEGYTPTIGRSVERLGAILDRLGA
jgi:sugar phosphate isomerase/epimerase